MTSILWSNKIWVCDIFDPVIHDGTKFYNTSFGPNWCSARNHHAIAKSNMKQQNPILWITLQYENNTTYIIVWANNGMCFVRTLQWRHNGRDGVSNHQPHNCLLNRLFGRRSKKTSKLRATGLCAGNSPGTGEFHAQRTSDAENVSIWWRHHDLDMLLQDRTVHSTIMPLWTPSLISIDT